MNNLPPKVNKNDRKINPPLSGIKSVLDLKISIATLEFHLETSDNLDVVREFENRVKRFVIKCEARRQLLQEKSKQL